MKIDLDNYEEYFLLYIDDELSQEERSAVEIFIKENKGLETEFEMLKSTVSLPDSEINLMDKSFLFRKEAPWINEENYEEIFILYHDGELSQSEKKETERFLATHPELVKEFKLLNQVKLVPETALIFTDKKSLYRKEKHGRIIPLIMWRSIAAAVFLGFGFWFFANEGNTPVRQGKMLTQINKTVAPVTNSIIPIPDSPKKPLQQSEDLATSEQSKENFKEVTKNYDVNPGKKTGTAAISLDKRSEKVAQKIATNIIKEKTEQIARATISKSQIDLVKLIPQVKETEEMGALKNQEMLGASALNANNASRASYISPEPDNENYLFYNIPADTFKKSKVGAFLKKMKRVVDRNDPIKLIFSGEGKEFAKIN